jgi:nucleotide-binding universal stress UspA family protein
VTPGPDAYVRQILVLANETVAGRSLLDAVRVRAAQGPIRVTVLSPQNAPRGGLVVYQDERRSAAERRLHKTLDLLHETGIAARGAVVDPDPLQALRDGIREFEPDEVIISTHPEERSGWLRGNLIDRAQKVAGDIPVEHVVVDLAEPRERAHVLVLGSQTVIGERLLDEVRKRAAASPAEFTVVVPADPPGAEQRVRRALAQLEAAGVAATGHVGDPDPVTAAMNAIHDERVDEIIVSTFPRETSGWLRRDVVGRIRKGTKLPVYHVEVPESEVAGVAS